jgi:hypothetical protein
MAPRVVQPEILDHLPADHPDARASRRDLRRINGWMGNYRWIVSRLRPVSGPPPRVLELGAGDGPVLPAIRPRDRGRWKWAGLDRAPRPAHWPEEWPWIQADVFSAHWPEADVIVANLFLHHFGGDQLRELFAKTPLSARRWIICEPVRRSRHVGQLFFLRCFGMNAVTWHDARVSIAAGFLGEELPRVLDPAGEWVWESSVTFFGSYRLEGRRQ